jgi:hypothetical protein
MKTTRGNILAVTSTILVLGLFVGGPAVYAGSNGNGAPSGPHYNLNIIGAKSTNCPATDSSGGNVIFVALKGTSNIYLQQGTTFAVLDNNACSDKSASFQLPAPGTYTIWARVEGIPGGSGSLNTCATDPATTATICSTGTTLTIGTRDHGNKFQDVTKQLTTLCYIPAGSTTLTCVNIFDPALQNYFWQYDNHGNKVLQLRFYPTA